MRPYSIEEYLNKANTPYTYSDRTTYQFYLRMPDGSRIAGCDISLRAEGHDIVVSILLPVNIMSREFYCVDKYLTLLNCARQTDGKLGYFTLDYEQGKIFFIRRCPGISSLELLQKLVTYCVTQVDYEIEDIIKTVCEESDRIFKEDEERRRQQEQEERGPGAFMRMVRKLFDKLGLVDDGKPDGMDDIPDYDDLDDEEPDPYDEDDEPILRRTEPEGEEQEQETEAEEEAAPPEAPAPRREPEFEEILKILGIDTNGGGPEEDEPAEEEAAEEEPAQEAEKEAAPAGEPKKEEKNAPEEE